MGSVWEDKGSRQGGPGVRVTRGSRPGEPLLGFRGRVTRWPLLRRGFPCRTQGPVVGAAGRGSGRQPRGSQLREGQAEETGKLTVGSRRGERKHASTECGCAGPRPREEGESRGGRLPGGGGGRSGGRAEQGSGAASWASAAAAAARGPPGSWESGVRERARARTRDRAASSRGRRGCLAEPPALPTPLLRRERPVGPHRVREVRGPAAVASSFWYLGRPEEPGPEHGGLTGPGELTPLDTKAELHVWRSPGAGRRPRGPCPGGTTTSPPPNASSKVPDGPGPRRPPAGNSLWRGDSGGTEGGEWREGGGGPRLRRSAGRTGRGCERGEGEPCGAVPGRFLLHLDPQLAGDCRFISRSVGPAGGVGISSPATPKDRDPHLF